MPESSTISPERITDLLLAEYGIHPTSLTVLPLGEDVAATLYRVRTESRGEYFLKLRRNQVRAATLTIPTYLRQMGVSQVVAPVPTDGSALSFLIGGATAILYPYIDGTTAFAHGMDGSEWTRFGALLRQIHEIRLPSDLQGQLEREQFEATWIAEARDTGAAVASITTSNPHDRALVALWREYRLLIERLMARAERLASTLRGSPPPFVLCHADIHLWNLIVDQGGSLWVVDWDDVRLAPRECDLIFGIGGIVAGTVTASDTESFLRGYGAIEVNPNALAFYRHHRALTDISAYTVEALAASATVAERAHAFEMLRSLFLPGEMAEMALASTQRPT